MTKWIFMPLFLLFFALAPAGLAVAQDMPTQSTFQLAVLLFSVSAFGLMLGLFWLSRLMPRDAVKMKYSSTMRWHKYIGYTAGTFFLVHPVLMVARRFWVEESNPIGNLKLMLASPLVLPGIIAWILMVILIVLALVRKNFPANLFRYIHGLLSIAFTGLATWHVITVGRHSNPVMQIFWITLAAGAVGALICSYIPVRKKPALTIHEGGAGESA